MLVREIEIECATPNGGTRIAAFEKRLSSREKQSAEAVARFQSEAALTAILSEAVAPRVTPRFLGSGCDADGPWLRTEALPSPTLASRMRGATTSDGIANLCMQDTWFFRACEAAFRALASLHEACDPHGPLGIVHGDISPANVVITDVNADGACRAFFLDFELSRWRQSPPRDQSFAGSVQTCAPEVARGHAPSVQSDIFSLAATLLQTLVPNSLSLRAAPNSLAAAIAHAADVPLTSEPALAALHQRTQASTLGLLFECIAHESADRPPSARHALALLEGVVSRCVASRCDE